MLVYCSKLSFGILCYSSYIDLEKMKIESKLNQKIVNALRL